MKSLYSVVDHELQWRQLHALKREYELHDGDEVFARLRFRSALGSLATAECVDGCWTFKRSGFAQTKATVRRCGDDQDVASFKNNTWTGGGTLELPDGRRYQASTNFWMTKYEIATADGVSLVKFSRVGGVLRMSATVQVQPAAVSLTELPWLVSLGWYLALMMQQDSAAAAV